MKTQLSIASITIEMIWQNNYDNAVTEWKKVYFSNNATSIY